MDIFNSRIDRQTIYDIYRACRLCGAGAGYKMPIIQNVVDLDVNGIELKQKIRDCVQIEVNSDDKMPPLICELCVDKVNDFYEFMEMCQQTNKRTRTRLGLPQQTAGKVRNDKYDTSDCILGVTEQVYGNDDSDEPLSGSRRPKPESKVKIKAEKVEKEIRKDTKNIKDTRSRFENQKSRSNTENSRESRTRTEINRESRTRTENNRESRSRNENNRDSRSRRSGGSSSRSRSPSVSRITRNKRQPTPPRQTRHTRTAPDENVTLNSLKIVRDSSSRSMSPPPRTTRLRKESSPPRQTRQRAVQEENVSLSSLKQSRKPYTPPASLPPPKTILKKDAKTEEPIKSKRSREPPPKPEVPQKKVKLVQPAPKPPRPPPPPAPPSHTCSLCVRDYASSQALGKHMRSHLVSFTNVKLACNPCELWFPTAEESATHHKLHKNRRFPYRCFRCNIKFTQLEGYDDHIANNQCLQLEEVPDVKCEECWKPFPTRLLMGQHRCGGPDARPGGKCLKCKRFYGLLKNLKKHEETCVNKGKSELVVDPEVMERIQPLQVRVARCDPLLADTTSKHYDVSRVDQYYGSDSRCVYPYRCAPMVCIKAELGDLAADEVHDLVHWDSDASDEGDRVHTLSTLSLKTIFSKKFLGKVPRKRRKVKPEKNAFDSTLTAGEFDNDFRMDIDTIINNLGNDDNDSVNSESLLFDGSKNDFGNFTEQNDSQSLILEKSDKDVEHFYTNERSRLEKDKDSISTDCETEVEDSKTEDKLKNTSRLSSENNETECTNNDFNDSNKVSILGIQIDDFEGETLNKNNDSSNDNNLDRLTNREVETEKSNLNDIDGNKTMNVNFEHTGDDNEKLIGDLDEHIGENNDQNTDINLKSDKNHVNNDESSPIDETNEERITKDNDSDEKVAECNDRSEEIDTGNKKYEEITENDVENDKIDNDNDDRRVAVNNDSSEEKVAENNDRNDEAEHDIHGTDNEKDNSLSKEQIPESNDESNEKCTENDDRLAESCDERIPEHNDSETTNYDTDSLANEQTTENNDNISIERLVKTNDKEIPTNDNQEKVSNEQTTINNDTTLQETFASHLNNDECRRTNTQEENDAICNDIESKINDLIALRNETGRNDWSDSCVTENNDRVSENCDGFTENNEIEKEKISLEDLLPPKNSELNSMDLDSISDDDFDFDA